MNRGIVVGKVYEISGRPASSAKVVVSRVESDSRFQIERIEAKVQKDGSFAAPFLWKGVEWGDPITSRGNIRIRINAWKEEGDLVKDGYSRDTGFTSRTINGYIARDIMQAANVATGNPFNGYSDFGDFLISIGQALSNYRTLVPFWKVSQVGTTEGYVLGAAVELWLDNTSDMGRSS